MAQRIPQPENAYNRSGGVLLLNPTDRDVKAKYPARKLRSAPVIRNWPAAAAPITCTGATAGKPGNFTPAGCVTPANLAGLTGITASPATAWTIGQSVVTANALNAYWNGTAWTLGTSP